MIPSARKNFNDQYSSSKNLQYQYLVQRIFDFKPNFNLLETPVFISNQLKEQLIDASNSIIYQLQKTEFRMVAHQAIPQGWEVPNEDKNPHFLQFDFAITVDKYKQPQPKLIEIQGFPALFFFQYAAWWGFQSAYGLEEYTPYFGGIDTSEYIDILRKVILGQEDAASTILLEIDPWFQRTAIDFSGAAALLGIRVCNIKDIEIIEKQLFYRNSHNKKIQIKRIFNRVILDELFKNNKSDLKFNLLQDVDVQWVGHPNWFLKYSKFALPFIQGDFSPRAFFLKDWKGDENLKNFVLKPIHSFFGNEVILNPTQKDIDLIENTNQYILQEKIDYAPILRSPDEQLSQLEISVLLVQDPIGEGHYKLMTTLVRAGRNNLINTSLSQEDTWTGGGIGVFMK